MTARKRRRSQGPEQLRRDLARRLRLDDGLARILGREVRWVGSHLTPWVWGRVRGHEFKTGGRCKRPDLLPVTDG